MKRFGIPVVILLILAGCVQLPLPGTPGAAVPSAAPSATPQTPPATSALPSASPAAYAAKAAPSPTADDAMAMAMRRDIDLLVAQSAEQQGQEQNYKNLKKEQTLTVERVTEKEIKFAGKPQVFQGDYTGRYTAEKAYRYFEEASMGGKRYYTVKDNFGVWISFQYQDPNFK